ncbi:MAG: PAS domain S-box protein [Spirochaetia bacterium]|jgi:PAS domain S-box-containing protein|nr:PAS domain S-box protein [Spirochaetia bacterium]
MKDEYRVLILEDLEYDAELIMDQVKLAEIDCMFQCVDTEAGFKTQIDEFKPDIILSDYSLPTYNGMSALKYVLENNPNLPVIIITGSINEETAVLCMKSGAVDYILKDNMKRLGLSIITALENKKNILEIRKAENEIKRLSTVVTQSPNAIVLMDNTGIVEYVNPAFIDLTGYESEEIVGGKLEKIESEGLSKEQHALILKDCLDGKIKENNFKNTKKNGEIFYVSSRFARYMNSLGEIKGLITVMNDISQRVLDQIQIENDLKEKELLLQEIYHRVNNNMQIMISLINMQINRIEEKFERVALLSVQSKIAAMSAIYNDIFQERSFVSINFKSVVSNIFTNLIDSLMFIPDNIMLHIETNVPMFGLDMAQPCALIVNELLSNCIHHAYPDGKGEIYVNLSINESDEILLSVKDNGIGIPEDINPSTAETGGFSLVHMLGQGQLDGKVNFISNNGMTVEIKFKKLVDKKRF